MKAIICTKYGPPEVLQLQEVAKPVPREHEVLVKVAATTVTAGESLVRRFAVPLSYWLLARLAIGWSKPRKAILGMVAAGEVEAVGNLVTHFQLGDQVSVSEKPRRLSSRMGTGGLIPKIAGTRFGSLYFNLSVLKHVGRKSGREYTTYLSAYPLSVGFVLTLAYPHMDWCSNILASGKCTLTLKGQEYELERPELIPMSEAWAAYPPITKLFALAGGEQQCLWVHKKQSVPKPARALA